MEVYKEQLGKLFYFHSVDDSKNEGSGFILFLTLDESV